MCLERVWIAKHSFVVSVARPSNLRRVFSKPCAKPCHFIEPSGRRSKRSYSHSMALLATGWATNLKSSQRESHTMKSLENFHKVARTPQAAASEGLFRANGGVG